MDRNNTQSHFAPLKDIGAALCCLTRLPVPSSLVDADRPLSHGMWSFPVIGALIGLIGGVGYLVAATVGLPALLAAVLALGLIVAVTGAFHEDGLADTADGFGGGNDRARKLEIMTDSRVGAFGVVALVLSLLARVSAIAALGRPSLVLAALVAAGALSRTAIVLMTYSLAPARDSGLGHAAGTPPRSVTISAIAIGLAAAFVLPTVGAVAAIFAAALATALMAWLAQRQIGGQTGDVLGAAQQVAEIAVLITLVAVTPLHP